MPFRNKTIKISLLAASAALANCSVPLPGISIFQSADSGMALNAGEASNVHFFTKEVLHDTGIALSSGAAYSLDVKILSNWMDSDIELNEGGSPLDERGFDNSLIPLELLGLSKRARDNNWFELMLVQPKCSGQSLKGVTELDFNEQTGSYDFTASCDGSLSLFVNDTYGFYGNNLGYANIAVSRVN